MVIGKHLLVHPNSRNHGPQMPQTMRINHAMPRREIKQLQAHGYDNPRNNQTRPGRPRPLYLSVSVHAEGSPQQVLCHPYRHVCGHVVRVVEPP